MTKNQYPLVLFCFLVIGNLSIKAQDERLIDEHCRLDEELALLFSRHDLEEYDPGWPFGQYPQHDIFE